MHLVEAGEMNHPAPEPIRVILFDFGGVIAEEGFYAGLRQIAVEQGLNPDLLPRLGLDAMYPSRYVTGQGKEQDFWRQSHKTSDVSGKYADLREQILCRFLVRDWALELVDKLRKPG